MKKAFLILIIINTCFIYCQSQSDTTFESVEEMPKFGENGNIEDFRIYIIKNIKFPPSDSLKNLKGKYRFVAHFVVDSLGQVMNIQVVQGVNKALDNAIIEALENSPSWTQGKVNGKAVNATFSFPLFYDFPDENNFVKDKKKERINKNKIK